MASIARVGRQRRVRWTPLLYLLPAGLVLLVFQVFPIFYNGFISLFNWRVVRGSFIGLDNYTRALNEPEFWNSLGVTVIYVVGTVPVALVLSFFIAYLLFQKIAARGLYRVIYFLPYVTSLVAVALVWKWIFQPDAGILNWFLSLVGLPPQRWLLEPNGVFALIGQYFGVSVPPLLAGPSLALVSLMLFAIWQALGFEVVVLLAGLSNIDTELYDAAKLDGATGYRLLRHITVPLLSPTLFFLSIVSVIRAFQAFSQIYVMTNGNPNHATETVALYIFHNFYEFTRLGYGAAVAMLLFAIILALTMVQLRVVGRRVHY